MAGRWRSQGPPALTGPILSSSGFHAQSLPEEGEDRRANLGNVRFEREVAGVEEAHFGVRNVTPVRLGALREKERIVLAPDSQQRGTTAAEILLELRVQRNIACIVEKQVELNLIIAGAGEQGAVEREGFGRNHCFVRNAVEVLGLGRFPSEEVPQGCSIARSGFFPVFLNRVPALAQAFLVSITILRNDRGDSLWMRQSKTQSDGGSVIEYVDDVPMEADRLSEAINDIGEILERVSELSAVGRIRKTESREVGSGLFLAFR